MEYTGTMPVSQGGKSYKVMLFLPEEVRNNWEALQPLIEAGLDSLEFTAGDLLELAVAERVQLWCMYEDERPVLAMATTFVNYPQRRTMHVVAIGGEGLFDLGRHFWPKVRDFMVRNECATLTAFARDAMSRALQRRFGFTKRYDVLERTIPGALQ